jgi:hypothetical protein
LQSVLYWQLARPRAQGGRTRDSRAASSLATTELLSAKQKSTHISFSPCRVCTPSCLNMSTARLHLPAKPAAGIFFAIRGTPAVSIVSINGPSALCSQCASGCPRANEGVLAAFAKTEEMEEMGCWVAQLGSIQCSSHSRAKITSKWGFAVLRRNLGTTYHAGPLGASVDQIGETRSHEAANRCLFVPYAWNPQLVPVGPRYLVVDSSFEKKQKKNRNVFFLIRPLKFWKNELSHFGKTNSVSSERALFFPALYFFHP